MSVTELDLEQLETYLDNALSPREADALRMRMGQEPELGAMLEELRVQRAQRLRVFESMEGSTRSTDAVMFRMQSSIRRMELQLRHRRFLRLATSAAACFVVGFGVAIMVGARLSGLTGTVPGNGFAGNPGDQLMTVANGPINGSFTTPVGNPLPGANSSIPESGFGPYEILLMNAQGQPVGIYRFSTIEEAQKFTDRLQQNGAVQVGTPAGERF